MKPTLILITGSFPNGQTETFLESEVPYLTKYFTVMLAPLRKSATVRKLPAGVEVDNSLSTIFDVPNRKLKSLFTFSFYKSLFHHINFATTLEAIKRINTFNSEYLAVKKWLQLTSPTRSIIYSYWLNGTALAAIEYKAMSGTDVRVVSRLHGYDAYVGLYKPPFFPYRKLILTHIDCLFPISKAGAGELIEQGAESGKINVSRLGTMDHNILTNASAPKEDVLRIVSVSNIYPVKRVDLIAKVVYTLAKTLPNRKIVWHHFGEGHLKETVQSIISTADLPNLSYKLWGQITNQALFEYYKTNPVDLFINLSFSEGIPVSIMEALSCGIPVVATNVGGTSEIVSHQQNGYLLSGNPPQDEVIEAIIYVHQNITDEKTREGIQARWKEEYSAEKNYTDFCTKLTRIAISYPQTTS